MQTYLISKCKHTNNYNHGTETYLFQDVMSWVYYRLKLNIVIIFGIYILQIYHSYNMQSVRYFYIQSYDNFCSCNKVSIVGLILYCGYQMLKKELKNRFHINYKQIYPLQSKWFLNFTLIIPQTGGKRATSYDYKASDIYPTSLTHGQL